MSEARVEQPREAHAVLCTGCRSARTYNDSGLCDRCEADPSSVWPPLPGREPTTPPAAVATGGDIPGVPGAERSHRHPEAAPTSPGHAMAPGRPGHSARPLDAGGAGAAKGPTIYAFEPWHDPAAEAAGHSMLSEYVERFWTPVVGPSSLLLVRHIVRELDRTPVYEIDDVTLGRFVGIDARKSRTRKVRDVVDRLGRFHFAERTGAGSWRIRTHVGDLPRRYHRAIPGPLASEHDALLAGRLRATRT